MLLSELKLSARRLIEGQVDKSCVIACFIKGAEQRKFQHLLNVAESTQIYDQEKIAFKTANYILANYNDRYYDALNSLIDRSSECLPNRRR